MTAVKSDTKSLHVFNKIKMNDNIQKDTINNDTTHCNYFVVRKKRYCRMTVKSGLRYCGEHEPQLSENIDSRLRIPCPLDNTHTCFASKLAKHLKKCNANIMYTEPYLLKNINLDEAEICNEESARQLSCIPTSKILEVIEKVNILFEDYVSGVITNKFLLNEMLTTEINRPEYGQMTRKHLFQISSLIEHLNKANLLNEKTCYIDFGAGKGQFSFWLSQKIQSLEQSSILLVERASLRHKMDNKLDKTEKNVHRIKADIADLVVNEVNVIKQCERVVGITKHLCGGATDLALRCLINAMKKGIKVEGLVMAFCCHHRCQWSNYTGKIFFENNQLSKTEFDIICGLVSWATCGSGRSRDERKNSKNEREIQENYCTRNNEINLTREEKELIGQKCKLLIDYGRLNYLQTHNFLCNLYYYVEQNVTLENVCIVARKVQ